MQFLQLVISLCEITAAAYGVHRIHCRSRVVRVVWKVVKCALDFGVFLGDVYACMHVYECQIVGLSFKNKPPQIPYFPIVLKCSTGSKVQ